MEGKTKNTHLHKVQRLDDDLDVKHLTDDKGVGLEAHTQGILLRPSVVDVAADVYDVSDARALFAKVQVHKKGVGVVHHVDTKSVKPHNTARFSFSHCCQNSGLVTEEYPSQLKPTTLR